MALNVSTPCLFSPSSSPQTILPTKDSGVKLTLTHLPPGLAVHPPSGTQCYGTAASRLMPAWQQVVHNVMEQQLHA